MFHPFRVAQLISAATVFSSHLFAQQPSGNDINSAIPIIFGQTVEDIGDSTATPARVYRINLARGQQFSFVASTTATNRVWQVFILAPSTRSIGSATNEQILVRTGNSGSASISVNYQVPVAGAYYVLIEFYRTGMRFEAQATATGTPIAVPNPTTAGCLTGRVDSITYSLQFIGMGLPDEVTIGGARACPSCTVKPPLYTEIASRLEEQMRANASVEACYDSSGNIFQLKLLRP